MDIKVMKFKYFIVILLVISAVFIECGCRNKPLNSPPPIIDLKDIIYPGSAPFEGAKYDYLAPDPPEKVAKWFEDTLRLKGAVVERRTASQPLDTKWVVTYKDLIIDIVYGPNQTDTLIRYKKDISKYKTGRSK
jgi:hypothetical protein